MSEETPVTPPSSTPAALSPPAPAPAPTPAEKPAVGLAEKFSALKVTAKVVSPPSPIPAGQPPKPEGEGGKATAAPDPDLAEVQRILDADRRNREQAKKNTAEKVSLEAQKAQAKAEIDAARAARDAAKNKDAIGALKALGFTEKDIYENDEDSILFKLAEAKAKSPEISERERFEKVVAEKLAEKDAAEKAAVDEQTKAAEAKAKEAREYADTITIQAKEAYSKNVFAIVESNPDKYRALAKWGVTAGAVAEYAWNVLVDSKGELDISEEEALADMEAHHRELSRAALEADKPAEEKKPEQHRGLSINPSWQAQTPGPARSTPTTLADKFSALKDKARKQVVAR